MDDELIFETDKCFFYSNSWTQGVDKWAKEWGLDDIRCFLAVQKNDSKDRDYVLVSNNEITYEDKNYESVAAHVDITAVSEGKKRELMRTKATSEFILDRLKVIKWDRCDECKKFIMRGEDGQYIERRFWNPNPNVKIRCICETCMKEKSTEDEWETIRDQIEIYETGMTRRRDFKSIMA
jgi:hypothetical protein